MKIWNLNKGIFVTLGLALVISVATRFVRPAFKVHSEGIVVITGASTGIGKAAALKLAESGFVVIAGVRSSRDKDMLWLGRSPEVQDRLKPFTIDVTDPETIDKAVREVGEVQKQWKLSHGSDLPLAAVFCNAGISAGSYPVELTTPQRDAQTFAVNFVGVAETARKFLPLLRKHQGRLLITGSVAGTIASPLGQPYSATKFAVKSLSDSLRRELKDLGVAVVRIEPGFIKTPILNKGMAGDNTFMSLPLEARSTYVELMDKAAKPMREMAAKAYTTDVTDKAIVHAITSERPQAVYHPGSVAGLPACIMVAAMNALGAIDPHWQDFVLELFKAK